MSGADMSPEERTIMERRNIQRAAAIAMYDALRDEMEQRGVLSVRGKEIMKARFDQALIEMDNAILVELKAVEAGK